MITATLVPSVIFGFLLLTDFLAWSRKSSAALPFGTFVALLSMWFGISLPLVFVGSMVGYRKPQLEYPVRTNQIPRQIPEQPWYLKLPISLIIGGFLPFVVIIEEIGGIYIEIWNDLAYYMYLRLLLITILVIVSTIEISVVITYFTLCKEDYRWWWKSFGLSSASSVYLIIFAFHHYIFMGGISGLIPTLIYFYHNIMVSIIYGVCMGTIGFLSTFFFVRKIYGAIKVD
ncbi:hypothetical protein EC973_004672 [Apophysomyces ossiformis]|uniref:Transmembrane 9 superfamily member n=1 Tax=Apophysomyces ossiformis TaxID=679940 RepID=A0A8H7BL18_9FUNG|nr:hypothetical protein EC973_004672 [Apophysomyces ossiformis]